MASIRYDSSFSATAREWAAGGGEVGDGGIGGAAGAGQAQHERQQQRRGAARQRHDTVLSVRHGKGARGGAAGPIAIP